jgi:hypothetical protein
MSNSHFVSLFAACMTTAHPLSCHGKEIYATIPRRLGLDEGTSFRGGSRHEDVVLIPHKHTPFVVAFVRNIGYFSLQNFAWHDDAKH